MSSTRQIFEREVWGEPNPVESSIPHTCLPFVLPSGGSIRIGGNQGTILLAHDAIFQPPCTTDIPAISVDPSDPTVDLSDFDQQSAFYSSTSPQVFAIAAVTIVSYMLVIILFITPRTFYVGGSGGGGISLLGRRGAFGSEYGNNTVIGIGSRPWFQKLAAITLAISLTIVSASTFKWAKYQYDLGYNDAAELTEKVINGLEIRIVRLISESFLWLAQAQTLIRLFQRRREKLIIKWTAFVLISLEIIFSALNHFADRGRNHEPPAFSNSIPALNYLFSLALNICYAVFVLFYAFRKRRYAFYHPQMHSMPLTALLSLTAVLVPAIIFILDLSQPDISGWGSYVRWVGACAASVVVWEWVERIEALEREERKDGILGREIFEEDELYDHGGHEKSKSTRSIQGTAATACDDEHSRDRRSIKKENSGRHNHPLWKSLKRKGVTVAKRSKTGRRPSKDIQLHHLSRLGPEHQVPETSPPESPSPCALIKSVPARAVLGGDPPLSDTPISRADTSSAASTMYVVRQRSAFDPTPPIQENENNSPDTVSSESPGPVLLNNSPASNTQPNHIHSARSTHRSIHLPLLSWHQRLSPPPEVAQAIADRPSFRSDSEKRSNNSGVLRRLQFGSRFRDVLPAVEETIFVPAPPRSGDCNTGSMEETTAASTATDTSVSPADIVREPEPSSAAIAESRSSSPHRHDEALARQQNSSRRATDSSS